MSFASKTKHKCGMATEYLGTEITPTPAFTGLHLIFTAVDRPSEQDGVVVEDLEGK